MWELDHEDSWAPGRTDAFKLWCWRRLLRVPWTVRDQSILRKSMLNIYWKDSCWSWSSNTLATWYKELTHWKRSWYWKTLRAGGEGDDRGWDGWMASLTQQTWIWTNREIVKNREVCHTPVHGVAKSWTQLSKWTTAIAQHCKTTILL